ncbi:uncharacterized protein TDEL_0D00320 [Torulaspora delbrueckii]|uniref:Transcription factor n=1 Tax=Torulaspora delbrueckii TaxID=4950 RepID=G8ZSM2_TORDE|nr:hypothetical protein TDEL_0D00320 [Torulaspora delbrueckii]CCE91616.1 hypothetical protein TDEL_0D00320 [Torulaspora delbrueckii]
MNVNSSSGTELSRPSTGVSMATVASNLKTPSNDFVRKLYGILERCEYPDIVRWTETGESFVVLDTGKFTTQILPNHFKHSNFASFVRQLNKYDFHKVKKTPEERQTSQYGELSWEFKHPFFTIHNEEALDNIKRKTTVQKKILLDDSTVLLKPNEQHGLHDNSAVNLILANSVTKDKFNLLKRRVDRLQKELELAKEEKYAAKLEFQKLNSKYNTIVESLITFKSVNDNLMTGFNQLCSMLSSRGFEVPQPFYDQMNRGGNLSKGALNEHKPQKSFDLDTAAASMVPGTMPLAAPSHPSGAAPGDLSLPLAHITASKPPGGLDTNDTSVLKEGFHVLLVEDDAVCIQLCSKFLRKYGCTVEVVTDGLSAISTLEKFRYDLVLMDIVMPNLDGATATSIVRSFDNHTPIIAMTGNIEDQDLITYLQHGMNDILAKPFTKDDLHSMLIRYLKDRVPLVKQQEERERTGDPPQTQPQSQPGSQPQSQPGSAPQTRSHSITQIRPQLQSHQSMQSIEESVSQPSSTVSESDVNALIEDEPLLKKQRVQLKE